MKNTTDEIQYESYFHSAYQKFNALRDHREYKYTEFDSFKLALNPLVSKFHDELSDVSSNIFDDILENYRTSEKKHRPEYKSILVDFIKNRDILKSQDVLSKNSESETLAQCAVELGLSFEGNVTPNALLAMIKSMKG